MTTILTTQQHDLARLYASGLRHPEIARRLGKSTNAVAVNLMYLRRKLGVRTAREIAIVLQDCEVREWDHRGNVGASGLRYGDPVRITGGRFAGREGTYIRTHSDRLWYVQINGGTFALTSKYIQPKEQA
jgi:DNA-binding CsgD family transcriptional regulator